MSVFARVVPAAYRILHLEALTRTRVGERIFLSLFFAYKKWIEDPHAAFARKHPDAFRGGHVLDVGANVGYTACVFALALDPAFRVHAFEPEDLNFARLEKVIETRNLQERVVAVHAAVGEEEGVASLRRNPAHPGDHRIVSVAAPDDVPVPIVRLDEYAARHGLAPVKYVKIDVQGHELAVCRGMSGLIERFPELEVSFEYSGAESLAVVQWFEEREFRLHVMRHDGSIVRFDTNGMTAALRERGYVDVFATRLER